MNDDQRQPNWAIELWRAFRRRSTRFQIIVVSVITILVIANADGDDSTTVSTAAKSATTTSTSTTTSTTVKVTTTSTTVKVTTTRATTREHSSSSLACTHFRNIAYDVANDLLTPAELRKKLKEVYEDSSIATPAIRAAAQEMLAAMTQDDGKRMERAVVAMDAACKETGH